MQSTLVTAPLSETRSTFATLVHREAPKVLGLMDREPFSPTRGCMDRTYWAWKFTDFPGARFQEGLCALSFLWSQPGDSPYFGNAQLLEWIGKGFEYWSSIQYAGGEFDEAYPLERSLAATAFTTFYLSEAWELLDGELPADTGDQFKTSLEKAGDWLVKNDETHGFLSNHLAAAATALLHAYRITGHERFERRSRYFIDKILAHQSSEGWYEEYGGADPGYQTHGSFYLSRYQQLTGDDQLLASLERSFQFMAHFVHPDGSLGGEYASRNTQTYYPAAFEMMASKSPVASWIASEMRPSVEGLDAAGLGSVDAYNYFPLMNNYVFASLAWDDNQDKDCPAEPPPADNGLTYFEGAGIAKVRTPQHDIFVGVKKGGVVKAFDRVTGKLAANDCGYVGKLTNGKVIASQAEVSDRKGQVTADEIVVEGRFYQSKKLVQRPTLFVGFRLFSMTVGRFRAASYWLKGLLVKLLIYKKKSLDLRFRRRITFDDTGFTINDHLQGSLGPEIKELKWASVFTTIHMGSSRYFIPNELELADETNSVAVDPTALAAGVELERNVSV